MGFREKRERGLDLSLVGNRWLQGRAVHVQAQRFLIFCEYGSRIALVASEGMRSSRRRHIRQTTGHLGPATCVRHHIVACILLVTKMKFIQ